MTVDTVFPTISPAPTPEPVADAVYKTAPPLTFTATDPEPGTTIFVLTKLVLPIRFLCFAGGTISIDNLSDGRHSVVVTVTDAAGNSTSSAPISFVLTTTIRLPLTTTTRRTSTISKKRLIRQWRTTQFR